MDYGNTDDLVLLAIIDNKTGDDIAMQDIGFQQVKRYDGINDLEELKKLELEKIMTEDMLCAEDTNMIVLFQEESLMIFLLKERY